MKKSTLIPLMLTAYLFVMAAWGYKFWADGTYSSLRYFGIIAVTLVIIILLHFHLKKYPRRNRRNK
ncbi:MAG: hypothetical protein HDS75_02335 [Bacteroidales bacterium]|nr:hypothetical protein [Bacteroidales bacterium]MDE6802319.1 hypothetical protein [Muribaculaceae bacterium]MDE6832488.1 hypothetical protein [Muribaculaceae bacterium]